MTLRELEFFGLNRQATFWSMLRPVVGVLAFLTGALPILTTQTSLADTPPDAQTERPNIVVILADDLGYGDVGVYGSQAIPTPHIDRLAEGGLRFTQGYAAAATCTPSRFSLLTGTYAWRQEGTRILPGNANLVISPEAATLPSILKNSGYTTGVVGKWHLGLGGSDIDWNQKITPGPLEVGFNSAFIMPATGDRVPCVYVRDHHVVGLDPKDPISVSYTTPFPGEPLGKTHPELLKHHPSHGHDMAIVNGISRIGYMQGGKAALWTDEDMADDFAREAVQFIQRNAQKPFFLYFALHDPHVPRVPHARFVGATKLGPRGDVIVQADWCVGQVLDTLERLNLSDNTLVILSSDNGPVIDDGYRDQAVEKLGDHKPGGPLRGGKYSQFEAGARVPFIVRWPAKVAPGVSDALVTQVDLLASLAHLTGAPLPAEAALDSFNVLPALLGQSPVGRQFVVTEATGRKLTLRNGNWKFIPRYNGPATAANTQVDLGNSPTPLLFDLAKDPGERQNVAAQYPEVVKQLAAQLQKIRDDGRTRPE